MSEENDRFRGELLVDIREPHAFNCGTIPGARNIPLSQIAGLYDLPRDKRVCVFCQVGLLSVEVAELLRDAGYDAYSLEGGYGAWLRERAAAELEADPEKP
ncbi:MAG: rhodanese-like domain-containing protein [Firmicutes bacterium]|nr:rhodanese-like domain-containing protein [Bacillota bacterium]